MTLKSYTADLFTMGEEECAEWRVLLLIIIFMSCAYRVMERRTEKGKWIYSRQRKAFKNAKQTGAKVKYNCDLFLIICVPYYLRPETHDVAFPFPTHGHYP